MKSKSRDLNSAAKLNKEPKLARAHAPADLSPLDWQRGLRRQFGREQAFELANLTDERGRNTSLLHFPVVTGDAILPPRWLDRPAISEMSANVFFWTYCLIFRGIISVNSAA